jgi:hypothetical protein
VDYVDAIMVLLVDFSDADKSITGAILLPALSAVLLAAMTVLAAAHFSLLLGIAPSDPTANRILIGFFAVALLGVLWALGTKKLAPERYEALQPATTVSALVDTGAHSVVLTEGTV